MAQKQAPMIAVNLGDVILTIAPATGPPKFETNNMEPSTTAAPCVLCPIASNASP